MTIPHRPESIALIDISYCFMKRYHTVNDGSRNAAAKATLLDIEQLAKGVAHTIICRDAPPYGHRISIYPEYKAHRPIPEPEELAQKKWLWQEIKQLGYNVGWAQGYEADDVIATLAKAYGEWCDDVRIVGPDKDCAQCITQHVKQYIPPSGDRDWEVRDVAAVKEKFGVIPELMPLYQGLVGDPGDNIPGVPKVGPKNAKELVNRYGSIDALAVGLATEAAAQGSKPSAILSSLAAHWETLVMCVKLTTLDTKVPLDIEGLLIKREVTPAAPSREMETNEATGQDGVTDAAFEEAVRLYQDKVPELQQAAKDAELLEKENDRERESNAEHDATSNAPGDKAAEPAARTKSEVVPKPDPGTSIVAQAPAYTQSRHGLVTADLQPLDLTSARNMAVWFNDGGLYPKFKNEQAVFTIMVKAKELGLKMTVALDNFHVIDGKPSASADLIRAMAARDPDFEYLMCIERSATRCVWRGKHKRHPVHVDYAYTIEEAQQAGLTRKSQYGKDSNWVMRPQDMISKTAASKLARELWPGATMGLYCFEEMGYTAEELDQREAA